MISDGTRRLSTAVLIVFSCTSRSTLMMRLTTCSIKGSISWKSSLASISEDGNEPGTPSLRNAKTTSGGRSILLLTRSVTIICITDSGGTRSSRARKLTSAWSLSSRRSQIFIVPSWRLRLSSSREYSSFWLGAKRSTTFLVSAGRIMSLRISLGIAVLFLSSKVATR